MKLRLVKGLNCAIRWIFYEIQAKLKDAGIELLSEVEEGTSGPASFMFKDPDGNVTLIDQHV